MYRIVCGNECSLPNKLAPIEIFSHVHPSSFHSLMAATEQICGLDYCYTIHLVRGEENLLMHRRLRLLRP